MATEWICDGCGKRTPGIPQPSGHWFKPETWFERNLSVLEDGTESMPFDRRGEGRFKTILVACSRECVALVAEKTKTSATILPI